MWKENKSVSSWKRNKVFTNDAGSTKHKELCDVCPHETTRLPLGGFSWNLIFEYFSKICRENSIFIKIWQKYRAALYMKSNIHRFSWNLIFEYFSKIWRENSIFIKIWQKYRAALYMKSNIHRFSWNLIFEYFSKICREY